MESGWRSHFKRNTTRLSRSALFAPVNARTLSAYVRYNIITRACVPRRVRHCKHLTRSLT
jgi:hypothetical protein